jgi:hypothetical protein
MSNKSALSEITALCNRMRLRGLFAKLNTAADSDVQFEFKVPLQTLVLTLSRRKKALDTPSYCLQYRHYSARCVTLQTVVRRDDESHPWPR